MQCSASSVMTFACFYSGIQCAHKNAVFSKQCNDIYLFFLRHPVCTKMQCSASNVMTFTCSSSGIQCAHRSAVFSYYWRHVAYPYGEEEREACNVFFVWEMMRPLLKGRFSGRTWFSCKTSRPEHSVCYWKRHSIFCGGIKMMHFIYASHLSALYACTTAS
jgi:hypothetical protein